MLGVMVNFVIGLVLDVYIIFLNLFKGNNI